MTKIMAFADICEMPNGPHKKFVLIKQFGRVIKGTGVEDPRTLGCDDLVAMLLQYLVQDEVKSIMD